MLEEKVENNITRLFDTGYRIQEIVEETGEKYSRVYTYLRGTHRNFSKVMENNNRHFIFNRRKRYKTFGIMVKAKLEKLGENQTWLSEQMGVSRQILSSYLRGICKPTKDPAMKLCRVLSLDYEYVQEILNIKFITRNYNRSQA